MVKRHVFAVDNLIIAFVLVAVLFANSSLKAYLEKQRHLHSAFPGNNLTTDNIVIIPEEIKRKWPAVKLKVRDNVSGKFTDYAVNIGGEVFLDSSGGLQIRLKHYVPDFLRDGEKIITLSSQANNPAVMVALLQGTQEIYSGWVFKKNPSHNTFTHGTFEIILGEAIEAPGFQQAENIFPGPDKVPSKSIDTTRKSAREETIRNYIGEGNTYHEMGRYDDAIGMYKKVLEIDPGNKLAARKLSGSENAKKVELRLDTLGR